MERVRHYTAFAVTATSVYLAWVATVGAVAMALKTYQIDIVDLENFSTAVVIHGPWLKLGRDLAYAAAMAPILILIRQAVDRRKPRVPIWIDVLGAVVGLALVVGFAFFLALSMGGRIPSLGMRPVGWGRLVFYSAVALGLLFGVRTLLARGARRLPTSDRNTA